MGEEVIVGVCKGARAFRSPPSSMIMWSEIMRRTTARKSIGEVLQDIYPQASRITEEAANGQLEGCEDLPVMVDRNPRDQVPVGPKRRIRKKFIF